MFSFLLSANSKMRRDAANWLEVAERVFHYRRDLLSTVQRDDLQTATGNLRHLLKDRAETEPLKSGIEKLEAVLARTGGRIYPTNSIVENVEFLVGAAILILGLRAYFFQPFKIPTNSMWPTYHGMTHEIFTPGDEPGPVAQVLRFLAFGASKYEIVAPADGEVYLAMNLNYSPAKAQVTGRMLGVIPQTQEQYYLAVGQELIKVDVPLDFNFAKMIGDALRDDQESPLWDVMRQNHLAGRGRVQGNVLWLPTGRKVSKGEPIATFHIHSGDLLFVDRISYHFVQPRVGDGFVFKTDNIHSPFMQRRDGTQINQYYIKRLVGLPGDKLEVREPMLLRNGEPISGADAFNANANQEGKYRGYTNYEKMSPGTIIEVPEEKYYAMGDNSRESSDSRAWGFVPEKDVVGRPLLIYYPFSKRWGPAR